MIGRVIKIIKNILLKLHINSNRKFMLIKNSHLTSNFRLTVIKPVLNKIYLNVGDNCLIDCQFLFESGQGKVEIGDNNYIGSSNIICRSSVIFEDNIFVAWGCFFYDHNSHSLDYKERENDIQQQLADFRSGNLFIENKNWDVVKSKPIKVCSNAWIGMNSLILKGVTIGEGAVVGAGSVVTKNVAPWTIVGGNPAVLIKEIPIELRKK